MKRIVLLVLVISIVFGCKKSLPEEVEFEKHRLNTDMQYILDKEEQSSTYRESKDILNDYKTQRWKTLNYKKFLENRGLGEHYNHEVIVYIDEKIAEYSNVGISQNNESIKHTCNICGKRFVGNGYTEVSTGLWQPTKEPYQSFICSRGCGALHTERQVKKYGF